MNVRANAGSTAELTVGDTVGDLLRRRSGSEATAAVCGHRTLTYAALHDAAAAASHQLSDQIGAGGHVGIYLPNGLDYLIAYFAIQYSGCAAIPLDPRVPPSELHATLTYCETPVVLTDRLHVGELVARLRPLGHRVDLLTVDDGHWHAANPTAPPIPTAYPVGGHGPDDVAIMLHTSGTTSRPKRVMLTHRSLLANVAASAASLGLTGRETTLVVLPLYFGYCHNTQLLSHVMLGGSLVIAEGGFRPRRFLALVEQHQVTNTTLVPALLQTLRQPAGSYDLSSWRLALFGGGPMPVTTLRQVQDRFPDVAFVQTYGQTEASPRVTSVPRDQTRTRFGTVGTPIPGVSVEVVGTDGQRLRAGDVGEIVVQGHLMRGYYKRPEETAAALRDGRLHTGDLGRIDPGDGHLELVGRLKNMLICAGENIYPEQIEEVLLSDPEVVDAQVYGEPHPTLGEVPVARVVPRPGCDRAVLVSRLRGLCHERLASFKVPSRIAAVEALPKTVTGKTIRYTEELPCPT